MLSHHHGVPGKPQPGPLPAPHTHKNGNIRSTNFYLRGTEPNNYPAIRTLAKAKITAKTTSEQRSDRWFLTTQLKNTSAYPALFVRVQAEREKTGDRILPAIYDSNYIALMPNESRTIKTEFRKSDTRGETPRIAIMGFNVDRA